MTTRVKRHFVEPMLLLRTDALPDDRRWDYQLKLDGYRAVAFRTGGTVHLRSRNDNDFSVRSQSRVDFSPRLAPEGPASPLALRLTGANRNDSQEAVSWRYA